MGNNKSVQSATLRSLSKEIFSGAPLYSIKSLLEKSGGIPLINIKDIVDSRIEEASLLRVDPGIIKNSERFTVYPGDVIITCRGTLIKIAVVPESIEKALITANLIAIRVNEKISPVFLVAYLKTKQGQKEVLSNVTSSTLQLVLNVSDIGEINILVPPMSLQEEIVNLANATEQQYHLNIESANLRRNISNQIIMEMVMNKRR